MLETDVGFEAFKLGEDVLPNICGTKSVVGGDTGLSTAGRCVLLLESCTV